MSLQDINLARQLLASVAVIASLVFLGIQIRGNTRALRSQGHYNAVTMFNQTSLLENPELARSLAVYRRDPSELAEIERLRCEDLLFMRFNAWEYFFYQGRNRSIPKNLWMGADAYFSHMLTSNPGISTFWDAHRAFYQEPFRSHVAAKLR